MDPKEINKTNFCNKSINNIISNDLKSYILSNMKLSTNISTKSKYAKLYNSNYSSNFKNPHIICLKTIGNPYLLFCTKINNVNYSLLIDKKIKEGYKYPKIFIINYSFDDKLFNGTLFETELVRDNSNNWFLLLSDIYYYNNSICNTNIVNRLNIIYDIMNNYYIEDNFSEICPLQVKKYFNTNDKSNLLNFINTLNYKIRGFYVIPLNYSYSNILYLFNNEDIKSTKNNDELVFMMLKTSKPEIYELYLKSNDNISKIDYAYISSIKHSQYIHNLFKNNNEIKVCCKYNESFHKWEPIKKTDNLINHINDLHT